MNAAVTGGTLPEERNPFQFERGTIPQLIANNQAQSFLFYHSFTSIELAQASITAKQTVPVNYVGQPENASWSGSESQQGVFLFELEKEFKELSELWYGDTKKMSFIRQKAIHPAYQKIIGMGWNALPLILRELKTRGGDWLWAIEAIVRNENPAEGMTNFKEAVAAWLAWGRENLHIS